MDVMFFFRTSYSFCKGTNLLSVKKGMLHLFLWLMIDIQTIIIAKKRYYPLNCNNRPIVLI